MPSKWKILAFCGFGMMFGLWSVVVILADTPEIIQESVVPKGVYFDNDLNIPSKEGISKKVSWYAEVVNVVIFANNPQLPLEVFVKERNGEEIWSAKFTGELKDSFVVSPGKTYTITILNYGTESLQSGSFSFETAYFTDKDGNFIITRHAELFLILASVLSGVATFIFAQYKMHKIGEKWTWKN